ncbi:hypothetical protein PSBY109024_11020 [Pseudoalteromonas byunsanensis]
MYDVFSYVMIADVRLFIKDNLFLLFIHKANLFDQHFCFITLIIKALKK